MAAFCEKLDFSRASKITLPTLGRGEMQGIRDDHSKTEGRNRRFAVAIVRAKEAGGNLEGDADHDARRVQD